MISFGRKSVLTRLYNEGALPSVKFDIYGKKIKQATVDHIIPKSKGGKSILSNYAIADATNNMNRSNSSILAYTTIENIRAYYEQFRNIALPNLNGNDYIEQGKKTFKKLNIEIWNESFKNSFKITMLSFHCKLIRGILIL